jgi:sirohydrochlorin cobaltochelatase
VSRGLLLVGHGSHLNADSSAPVRQHAAAIRRLGLFDEVSVGFWKEEPSLSRALDPFESNEITVVPVFISAGYFTNEVIPREMGLTGELTEIRGKTVRYTPPIGSRPALANVIIQRAREAGAQPGDTLAVLGHGTPATPTPNATSTPRRRTSARSAPSARSSPSSSTSSPTCATSLRSPMPRTSSSSPLRR